MYELPHPYSHTATRSVEKCGKLQNMLPIFVEIEGNSDIFYYCKNVLGLGIIFLSDC